MFTVLQNWATALRDFVTALKEAKQEWSDPSTQAFLQALQQQG